MHLQVGAGQQDLKGLIGGVRAIQSRCGAATNGEVREDHLLLSGAGIQPQSRPERLSRKIERELALLRGGRPGR